MIRVKFLAPGRYARVIASEPQFSVEVGTVIELSQEDLDQIPSERYEVLDSDYVEPAAKIDEPDDESSTDDEKSGDDVKPWE